MAESPNQSIEGTLHSVDGAGVVRMTSRFEVACDDLWSALTESQRLAGWYGTVDGEFRVGGPFTAFVTASEWDGQGRIDACVPQHKLVVTMWEKVGAESTLTAILTDNDGATNLELEVRGVPLDLVWAYGAGWHVHMEDLETYLSGRKNLNLPSRWDELEPMYRGMTVVPL